MRRGHTRRGIARLVGLLVVSLSLVIALALPRDAHAASPDRGTGMEVRLQAAFAVTRAMPDLQLSAPEEVLLPSREAVAGTLPTVGGFRSFGASADMNLVLRPRFTIPIFGLGLYLPVGDHAPIRSAVDGSIATVQPWRLIGIDFLGPGFGVRTVERRYFFEASVRFSILVLTGTSQVAAGREAIDVQVHGIAPGARAEMSACRRLDPESRVCLTVSPRLFEVRPLSGMTVGLTWVWGN